VSSPPEPAVPLGLRERKKARTRAAIQEHALQLFREHGYEATTTEQIAEAAEISPSTFFRYFPTKEDVLLHDRYDPLMIDAYRAQPESAGPVRAFRNVIRLWLTAMSPEELAAEEERQRLIISTPELRARMLDQLGAGMAMLAEMVAERVKRPPSDAAVQALAGAIVGIAIAAMLESRERPLSEFAARMDKGLAQLERGLPV